MQTLQHSAAAPRRLRRRQPQPRHQPPHHGRWATAGPQSRDSSNRLGSFQFGQFHGLWQRRELRPTHSPPCLVEPFPVRAVLPSHRPLHAQGNQTAPHGTDPLPILGRRRRTGRSDHFRFPVSCQRPELGAQPLTEAACADFPGYEPRHLCRSERFGLSLEATLLNSRAADSVRSGKVDDPPPKKERSRRSEACTGGAGGTRTHGRRIMSPLL